MLRPADAVLLLLRSRVWHCDPSGVTHSDQCGLHVACQASLSFTIPRSCSNSCPLSQWGHPTISSSVTPFFSCPQSFSASGSFPMSHLLCCWKRVFAMTSVFSWEYSVSLYSASFLFSKAKLACYSRYLLTFYFCILLPCDEKDIFLLLLLVL